MSQGSVVSAAQWGPVALSRDLEPGSILGTQVCGVDIVVWREQTGTVHAWPDRCPHRGMRLSLGFVRGDQLGCPYHGWRFGADGECRFIPAQPQASVPRAPVASRLGCTETAAMIWVATEPADAEPPSQLGRAYAASVGVRSVYVRASAGTVCAELPALLRSAVEPTDGIVHASVDGWAVSVGIQILSTAETAAHVTCQAGAPLELQLELARGAAALRQRCEQAEGGP